MKKINFITAIIIFVVISISKTLLAQTIITSDTLQGDSLNDKLGLETKKKLQLKAIMEADQDSIDIIIKDRQLTPLVRHQKLIRMSSEKDIKIKAILTPEEYGQFRDLMQAALWERRKDRLNRSEAIRKLELKTQMNRKAQNINQSKISKGE